MNKRLIVLFIGLIFLVIIIVLNSTLFVISDISVSSDSGTSWFDPDAVILSSKINKGRNIFALSETKALGNIESAHSNIRVVSIERKFPNKIIIHITLRVPVIAIRIEGSGKCFITDWELNVIDVVSSDSKLYKDSALIKGIAVTVNGEAESLKGKKLEDTQLEPIVEIARAAASMGIADAAFNTFFDNIDFSKSHYAYIKTNAGVTFVLVIGTDTSIEDQFQAVYSYFVSLEISDSKRSSGYFKIGNEGWEWSAAD